jgi:SAM-dependent methyltransferase
VNGIPILAPDVLYGDGSDAQHKYDDLCAAEDHHFWFYGRSQLLDWALRTYFPNASSLLEVGCGTGGVLRALRRNRPAVAVTGSDIHWAGLQLARERNPDVSFLQFDARELPFEHEFDIVGAFDVLEHIEDDERVLRRIFTATRPGGGLVVMVPQHPSLWSWVDTISHHKRRYRRGELVQKISAAGFHVVRATSFMSLLLPLMLLWRLRERVFRHTPDPSADLRPPGALNALLRRVMDLERMMIQAGVSLPAGGSLLCVARVPASPVSRAVPRQSREGATRALRTTASSAIATNTNMYGCTVTE